MKKIFLSLTSILMMALVSVSLVACGDDDDDNGGGGNSSSSGIKVNANYGFFHKNSSTSWEFYFFSHDVTSASVIGKSVDVVSIELETKNGSDNIPEGEFTGCFAVDVVKGMKASQDGKGSAGEYYESGSRSKTTGKLTIKKNSGNNYTVSYTGVNFYGDDSNTPTIENASFSFTGTIIDYPMSSK